MSFIQLYETTTIQDPGPRYYQELFPDAPDGMYLRDDFYEDDPFNRSDYRVYACFRIIEQDFSRGFYCFRTRGTSSCLSLYSMVQGLYHLTAFASGAEISEDFYDINSDQVLKLPLDYEAASQYINENLIGKKLRVVARTKPNSTRFGTRYYLFVIED